MSAELRTEALRLAQPFRQERAKIRAILSADVYREPTEEEKARVHARMAEILAELRGAGSLRGEKNEADPAGLADPPRQAAE